MSIKAWLTSINQKSLQWMFCCLQNATGSATPRVGPPPPAAGWVRHRRLKPSSQANDWSEILYRVQRGPLSGWWCCNNSNSMLNDGPHVTDHSKLHQHICWSYWVQKGPWSLCAGAILSDQAHVVHRLTWNWAQSVDPMWYFKTASTVDPL